MHCMREVLEPRDCSQRRPVLQDVSSEIISLDVDQHESSCLEGALACEVQIWFPAGGLEFDSIE